MILVGTAHYDFQGPRRLSGILNVFQPRSIGVESPVPLEQAVQKLDELAHIFEREIQKTTLPSRAKQFYIEANWLSGYEVREAFNYAQDTGATTHPIDQPNRPMLYDPRAMVEWLVGMKEKRMLPRGLLRAPHQAFRSAFCAKVDELYGRKLKLMTPAETEELLRQQPFSEAVKYQAVVLSDPKKFEERESTMAELVRQAKPDMVICGASHIIQGNGVRTLYDRIKQDVQYQIMLPYIDPMQAPLA